MKVKMLHKVIKGHIIWENEIHVTSQVLENTKEQLVLAVDERPHED